MRPLTETPNAYLYAGTIFRLANWSDWFCYTYEPDQHSKLAARLDWDEREIRPNCGGDNVKASHAGAYPHPDAPRRPSPQGGG